MAEPNVVLRILVVDDDATCLSLVSGYLKKKNHHVIATKNPLDALCTLRMQWQSFDLILTDVHMPQMSGFDLLNHSIEEQFRIPIVLMSSDSDVAMMKQGLKDGASHYFVKPMGFHALDRIWQFSLPHNPNHSSLPSNLDSIENTATNNDNNYEAGNALPAFAEKDTLINNNINAIAPDKLAKKPKLIWTTSLHNRFLEAVHKIGPHRAVPKKILEYMDVPGLKRENIASHLQKYRIFLKRISTQQGNGDSWNERPLRSSFVLNEISFLTNNLQRQYQQLLGNSNRKGRGKNQAASTSRAKPSREEVGISRPSGQMQAIRETSDVTTTNNVNYSNLVNVTNNENINLYEINTIKVNEGAENSNYVPSNYVGLRLNCNGELFGTLKDMSPEFTINDIGTMTTHDGTKHATANQRFFNNDDFSLNYNYAQEYGHNYGDYMQAGWRV